VHVGIAFSLFWLNKLVAMFNVDPGIMEWD
jgi:hypothetical protein